jgi:hypothetical protein
MECFAGRRVSLHRGGSNRGDRRDRKLGRHGSRFLGYQAHVCFLASYPIEDSGKENRRIKECSKGA